MQVLGQFFEMSKKGRYASMCTFQLNDGRSTADQVLACHPAIRCEKTLMNMCRRSGG